MIASVLIINLSFLNYDYYFRNKENINTVTTIIIYAALVLASLITLYPIVVNVYIVLKKFFPISNFGKVVEIISPLICIGITVPFGFTHIDIDIMNGIVLIPLLLCTFLFDKIGRAHV